jgi:single-stranded DNA-binding protein
LSAGVAFLNFAERSAATQERTEWFRVVAFGKLADTCERFLSKGRQVYVEGRLGTREYETKDGTGKRTRTEVIARQIRFLGSPGNLCRPLHPTPTFLSSFTPPRGRAAKVVLPSKPPARSSKTVRDALEHPRRRVDPRAAIVRPAKFLLRNNNKKKVHFIG